MKPAERERGDSGWGVSLPGLLQFPGTEGDTSSNGHSLALVLPQICFPDVTFAFYPRLSRFQAVYKINDNDLERPQFPHLLVMWPNFFSD